MGLGVSLGYACVLKIMYNNALGRSTPTYYYWCIYWSTIWQYSFVLVYKKFCSHSCRVVIIDNYGRLTENDIIIGSAYMPFNDNYRRHYDDFLDYLVRIRLK